MPDAGDIDDGGTMHAQELLRLEAFFDFAEAEIAKMFGRARVQQRVIIGRFDPFDIGDAHRNNFFTAAHQEAFRKIPRGLRRLQQTQQTLDFAASAGAALEGALDGRGKTCAIKRFQQIIDGIHFKRANGILVIRG
ncbi:MAG: hypothetical protein ALAOOOJD_01338 [bacterium]|nr:hypothetical protein [bacterium]